MFVALPSRTNPTLSPPPAKEAGCTRRGQPLPVRDWPVSPPSSTPTPHSQVAGYWTAFRCEVLLRKEVIQPHLPVRLPCYDFVPIASPTFDGSLPLRG